MHARDFVAVGLAVDITGAILLARGFIRKGIWDMYDESRTHIGGNSFVARSALLQRAEAWAGATLLVLGFVLQIVGTLLVRPGVTSLPAGTISIAWLLAIATLLYFVAQWVASIVGKRHFYSYFLRNYVDGTTFQRPSTDDEKNALFRNGRLYDIRPRRSESIEDFADRLNAKVKKLGLKYGRRMSTPKDRGRGS